MPGHEQDLGGSWRSQKSTGNPVTLGLNSPTQRTQKMQPVRIQVQPQAFRLFQTSGP